MSEKCVLYVEDDLGSRKVMRGLIKRLSVPVHLTIFEDSTGFLARVEALDPQPDVFLLDIHVSPCDGFQMLEMLRKHDQYANKMIVALTASVMNEEVNRLKDAGYDGVLAKPLDFYQFPSSLERILAGEHLWSVIR